MSKGCPVEEEFYLFARMAGIEQKDPTTFFFDGRKYTTRATINDAGAKAMGGKRRAFKLLRHAALIQHVAAQPNGAHVSGIVAKSFDAISQKYPLLRSYYVGTMIGADHHTWMRW